MKTVLLIRHAKSSWDNIGEADIDRPLNERGKKDAPEMAKRIKKRDLKIDGFITSNAKRARRTAGAFAEEFGLDKKEVVINEDLYGAYASGFDKVIASLPKKYKTVALFSHNPGITEYVNTLTGVQVDNMPTAAIFAVSSEAETWEDFKTSEKQFLFFDYPKNPL